MRTKISLPLLLLLSASYAFASEPRLIVATGTCSHDIQPDRGSIVLTADFLDRDMNQSIQRANTAYEKTEADIQKLKLADGQLTTVEYSTQKQTEWEKDHNVFKGYRTRIGLRVATSDLKRLGEIIPIAARNQVRDIGQIATYLSNETSRRERGACLKEAVENARAKAENMAQGLGASLGPAVVLRELGDESEPAPRMMIANAAAAMDTRSESAGQPPHFEPGKQSVHAAVQASFGFTDK
ncbi:MAG: SIMPL domain-containing protein [Deltaproteobacteria bacterium]|nr:SIMPL domain-containing protein [Deltaproteobacteria bacterium]